MKKIILMRHSYALSAMDSKVKNDDLRPLSPRGVEEAQDAVILLKQRVAKIDRILTSTRARATETADIIGKAFNVKPEAYTELCREQPITDLWAFIRKEVDEGSVLLAVGHNPDFSELVSTLAGTHISLNPAEFAIFNFDNEFEKPELEPINPQEEK
ncbi:phosphohistidine phosphatase [Elusimicrobium posterum]|uniref:SixA phosphatase family protein n=1 Tax=Elusimicrobium posterum TaxID=3116653 RepID=UPI003C77D280